MGGSEGRCYPAECEERQTFDLLLVGYNLIGTGRKWSIDAVDAEAMFENDGVSTGSDGHIALSNHIGAEKKATLRNSRSRDSISVTNAK
jgi:hypothetical protein